MTNDMLKVAGVLKLHSNLYEAWGKFQLDDEEGNEKSRTSYSEVIASALREEGRWYVFSYVAKATVSNPDPTTDEQSYLFAAEVRFDQDDLMKGVGTYWTNRKYASGHNAAGEMVLTRIIDELAAER